MRLPNTHVEIEQSEVLGTQAFGIREKDMGIILDILRSKMYSDPIVAICREVACNAVDANKEAGREDEPIEITLPSALVKQIVFKDHGHGISPRRMADIFMNYGASTKRRDNSQIGGFGIGAKSPFSYSDTFSIISVYGGKKRQYTALIDDTRSGRMDLISEEDSDDPTGTSIVIPVKDNDFRSFGEAVISVTKFFKVRPTIKNLPAYMQYPERRTPILTGDGWSLLSMKKTGYYSNSDSGVYALIGGIGYKVSGSGSYGKVKYLTEYDIEIDFKIGELSLSASRDSLHYDDKTIAAITKHFTAIHETLVNNAKEKVKTAASYVEAEQFWSDFMAMIAVYESTAWVDEDGNEIKLQGTTRAKTRLELIDIDKIYLPSGKVNKRTESVSRVDINNLFVINDCADAAKRCKAYIDANKGAEIYLLNFSDDVVRDRWMDELGVKYFKHVNASEIDANYVPRKRQGVPKLDGWTIGRDKLSPVKIDRNDSLVYVIVNNKSSHDFDFGHAVLNRLSYHSIPEVLSTIKADRVVFVKAADIPKLKNGTKFYSAYEEKMKEYANLNSSSAIGLSNNGHSLADASFFNGIKLLTLVEKFGADHILVKYKNEKLASPALHQNRVLGYCEEMFGKKKCEDIPELLRMGNEVKARYPLAFYCNRGYYPAEHAVMLDDLVHYVKMVDGLDRPAVSEHIVQWPSECTTACAAE